MILLAVVSSIGLPNVMAKSTFITHLDVPSTAVLAQSGTVRVGATYDLGSNGYAVSIGRMRQKVAALGTGFTTKNDQARY